MSKIVTVIDLASDKIIAALANINKNGSISFLAFENLQSRGIEGDDIIDFNKTVEEISSIINRLQSIKKKRIKNVYVTVKDADIKMDISRGMVPLAKTPREITKRDIDRCLENASLMKLPLDRGILEKLIRGFYIDGGMLSITSPIGLYGIKLEAEVLVVTISQSKIQNITKCIDHAGFLLEGMYLSSIASSNSILDEKEREEGVLLLDIGESLTEELFFKHNMLNNFRIIKKGAGAIRDGDFDTEGDFSSVVVTGGGALLDGIIERIESIFKKPARLGIVKNGGRNLAPQDTIIHTSTIGLINRLAKEYKALHTYKNPLHKAFHKILDIYESYF